MREFLKHEALTTHERENRSSFGQSQVIFRGRCDRGSRSAAVLRQRLGVSISIGVVRFAQQRPKEAAPDAPSASFGGTSPQAAGGGEELAKHRGSAKSAPLHSSYLPFGRHMISKQPDGDTILVTPHFRLRSRGAKHGRPEIPNSGQGKSAFLVSQFPCRRQAPLKDG